MRSTEAKKAAPEKRGTGAIVVKAESREAQQIKAQIATARLVPRRA